MSQPWTVSGAAIGALVLLLAGCTPEPDAEALHPLGTAPAALRRAVDPAKELLISDPSVIASPLETTFDPAHPSGMSRSGAWSFGRLVHNLLPPGERDSAVAASRLVSSGCGRGSPTRPRTRR